MHHEWLSSWDESERFKIENQSFGLKERDIHGQGRYADYIFAQMFPMNFYTKSIGHNFCAEETREWLYFQRNDFVSLEFRLNISEIFYLVSHHLILTSVSCSLCLLLIHTTSVFSGSTKNVKWKYKCLTASGEGGLKHWKDGRHTALHKGPLAIFTPCQKGCEHGF